MDVEAPSRASEVAHGLLRDRMVDLTYPPGALVNELQLSRDVGLGRMPVREAVARLAREGFLSVVPRRGMVVASMSLSDVVSMLEAREVLETGLVREVCTKASDDDLAELAQLFGDVDAAGESGDYLRFLEVDYRAHAPLAELVLERLPQHALLVGEGAALFAQECGFETADLLTPEARELWRRQLVDDLTESVEGERTAVQVGDLAYSKAALELVRRLAPHDGPWGTINVLALDASGEMCTGVSTSGYPYKYPGRVGDSAVPGAGNYCDLRYGGAACTGRGELSMRAGTARRIVDLVGGGMDLSAACQQTLDDAALLPDAFRAELRALALTPDGRHGGAARLPGATYSVITADESETRTESRTCA